MKADARWLQAGIELRGDGDQRRVGGYAAVYDSWSEPLWGGTREIIRPGAFDGADLQDTICLFNHSYDQILGTVAAGTLRLNADERGLAWEVDLPDTPTGREVYELIRRGDLTECSFGFFVDMDSWVTSDEGDVREILRVRKVDDVGPVTRAAYRQTSVSVRDALQARLDAERSRQREYLAAVAEARRKLLEVIR